MLLDDTNVTDVSMQHIEGLTRLHALSPENTRVTDAGLTRSKLQTSRSARQASSWRTNQK